jgi:hypothetical protein
LFKNDILIDGDIKTEFDNGDILNEEYETGKACQNKIFSNR